MCGGGGHSVACRCREQPMQPWFAQMGTFTELARATSNHSPTRKGATFGMFYRRSERRTLSHGQTGERADTSQGHAYASSGSRAQPNRALLGRFTQVHVSGAGSILLRNGMVGGWSGDANEVRTWRFATVYGVPSVLGCCWNFGLRLTWATGEGKKSFN